MLVYFYLYVCVRNVGQCLAHSNLSFLRLDRYRGDPKEEHKDFFDFECHIYVDDAFMQDKETEKKFINSYVEDLISVVIEVYR